MCHSLPKWGKRQCQASHIRGNIHQVGPFPKIYRAVLYVNRQDCNMYYCDVRLTSWTDLLLLENSTSNKNEVEKVKQIIALNSSKYNLQKGLGLVWQLAVFLTACRPQWHAWQKGRELAKAKSKCRWKNHIGWIHKVHGLQADNDWNPWSTVALKAYQSCGIPKLTNTQSFMDQAFDWGQGLSITFWSAKMAIQKRDLLLTLTDCNLSLRGS